MVGDLDSRGIPKGARAGVRGKSPVGEERAEVLARTREHAREFRSIWRARVNATIALAHLQAATQGLRQAGVFPPGELAGLEKIAEALDDQIDKVSDAEADDVTAEAWSMARDEAANAAWRRDEPGRGRPSALSLGERTEMEAFIFVATRFERLARSYIKYRPGTKAPTYGTKLGTLQRQVAAEAFCWCLLFDQELDRRMANTRGTLEEPHESFQKRLADARSAAQGHADRYAHTWAIKYGRVGPTEQTKRTLLASLENEEKRRDEALASVAFFTSHVQAAGGDAASAKRGGGHELYELRADLREWRTQAKEGPAWTRDLHLRLVSARLQRMRALRKARALGILLRKRTELTPTKR